jgi:small subunit ribosomal protein S14
MPHYIKLYIDDKGRKRFNERFARYNRLNEYLFNTSVEQQTRRFKTYCQLTGASRSIYSQFGLSRHCLRKYANFGLIPGVRPASW